MHTAIKSNLYWIFTLMLRTNKTKQKKNERNLRGISKWILIHTSALVVWFLPGSIVFIVLNNVPILVQSIDWIKRYASYRPWHRSILAFFSYSYNGQYTTGSSTLFVASIDYIPVAREDALTILHATTFDNANIGYPPYYLYG